MNRIDRESDEFSDDLFGDLAKFRKQAGPSYREPRYAKLVGDEVVECPLEEWIKQFEREVRQRVIQQETVGDRYWVSTVFLGLDHGFMEARGIWFESMVFDNYARDEQHGYRESIYCERYSTMAEARRGHLVAVDHAQQLLAGETE